MTGTALSLVVMFVTLLSIEGNADPISAGKAIYFQTCVACHGANGRGAIPGVRDLAAKGGPLSKSDDVLLKNITEGYQSPGAPLSMPAKGGNPTLTAGDLESVLGYIRAQFGS